MTEDPMLRVINRFVSYFAAMLLIACFGELSAQSFELSRQGEAPSLMPYATIDGEIVVLRMKTMENPKHTPLKFVWFADSLNPASVKVRIANDSASTAKIPKRDGHYFFNVLVTSASDSVWFRTYVARRGNEIVPFDIEQDRASWIDTAILYQITPYKFSNGEGFDGIRKRLPELQALGVNTLFLQPVYKTHRGAQGYDVIDYFSVRSDLGTEEQLRNLILTAKKAGFRVLFDFVPNHTSIHHPYAESVKRDDTASAYYDFYQHKFDGAMYSSHYNKDNDGFIYYFWKDLVNLNYDNEAVQRWILDACSYWVREFDIDGYRFDAVWGVNARKPSFGKRLRNTLKSIKPEIFLLAEDKPGPHIAESGFDAAYDWTMDTSWVSQWSWAYEYHERENRTIFNFPDENKRGKMLWDAIMNVNASPTPVLRFMENNDLARFGMQHNVDQTKMVAALMFSLPGIPMLYNGQEVGALSHPYSRDVVYEDPHRSIRSMNPALFDYYRKLIRLRQNLPALHQGLMSGLRGFPDGSLLAFRRWKDDQHCVIVLNMSGTDVYASLNIGNIFPRRPKYLRDLISADRIEVEARGTPVRLSIAPFTTRLLLVEFE